ncbi:MAG TPA: stalk domain-containing protein [Bacillota bacterium]|nr:stalk domain-containing protein [Bacillota bacterium]
MYTRAAAPGRTFIPPRFVSEALGAQVEDYAHETRVITIVK